MRRTRILAIDHFMKIFRVSEISWFHVIHFARPLVAPPQSDDSYLQRSVFW